MNPHNVLKQQLFFFSLFFPFYLKGLREFDKVLLNLLADIQLSL